MTLKKFLSLMSGLTFLLFLVFIFIFNVINPETSTWLGFTLFYFSLFLCLSGVFIIFGYLLRKKFSKKTINFYLIRDSFRQSFLFSFLIISTLFMLAENLFSWTNIIILVIILSIIEYILINEKK